MLFIDLGVLGWMDGWKFGSLRIKLDWIGLGDWMNG